MPICAVIQTNLSASNLGARTAISLDLRVTTVIVLKMTIVLVLKTMTRALVLKSMTRIKVLTMMRVLVLKVRRATCQTMNNQTKIIDLTT